MTVRVNRRSFLGASTLVAGGAAFGGWAFAASALQGGGIVGEALPPTWRFVVLRFEDPYLGDILRPEKPKEGTRYVGAEVEIRNESDAALNFDPSGIRLVDTDRNEYPNGGAVGSDPRIVGLNMLPGERTRGWVWFAVPEQVQVYSIVYQPPTPRLEVPLEGGAGESATPASGG